MRILVSGGTGLVGRALVDELVASGHSCSILSRADRRPPGLAQQIGLRQWDAVSSAPLVDLLSDYDAVVHLAGESIGAGRWTSARKGRILDSRVASTRALTEALRQTVSPPAVFVQASAVGYYGPRGDEVVTEQTGPGTDFLARVCAQWEAASSDLDGTSTRRAVARTGIVLSAAGGALPRMALPFRLFAGGPAGSGRQWMPWIHLQDEVRALRFLVESDSAVGAFNLTAPQPVTNREFSRVLGRVLRRPSLMPAPAMALRAALGEMAVLILEGQRAVPSRLQELGFEFSYTELETALRDIF